MKKFKTTLAGMAFLAICSCVQPQPQSILCIGDSSLYARSEDGLALGGFPDQLAAMSSARVLNEGIAGATTGQVHFNFGIRHKTDRFYAIAIRVGWNDLKANNIAPAAFRESLVKLARAAHKHSDRVYLIRWEVADGAADELNAIIASVSNETDCLLITAGLDATDFMPSDPVHPTASGGAKIAQAIFGAMRTGPNLRNILAAQ